MPVWDGGRSIDVPMSIDVATESATGVDGSESLDATTSH
jgi:hypothetical protein